MTDTCDKCHRPIAVGDFPFCPHGRSEMKVIDDSIPGGPRMFENLGPEPVYIQSKSQLRAECAARGIRPFVRHVGVQGSDRSKETQRWI
jgi:hypothetical protein